jgi:hypothetical protein
MYPARPTHADRVQTSGARNAANTLVGRDFFFATANADGDAGVRLCRRSRALHHPPATGDGRQH